MTNEFKKECGVGMYWCNTDQKCKPIEKKTKDMREEWSQKYKKSIDCNNPKGFSQKAHCQGRKKRMSEDAPANAVGTGAVAGIGVGSQGEPGVNKKKGLTPFLSFIRRKKPQ